MNKKTREYKKSLMTVKDLIEHLKQMDQDAPVGRTGHFGEFHPMDKFDFYEGKSYLVLPTQEWRQFSYDSNLKIKVIDIISPDIGPDPD